MRFESIDLTNYRGHESLHINFNPGFNVIAGVNGSGKTSVLKAICDVMTGYTQWLSVPGKGHQPMNDPGLARVKGENHEGRHRFEPQYPVKISATATVFEDQKRCTWTIEKTSEVNGPALNGTAPGHILNAIQTAQSPEAAQTRARLALPVIAFYRAYRQWNQPRPNELQAATARNSRTDGYASWWDASLDASALQAWVIGKSLERFQLSSETGIPFNEIATDELALVNQALGLAVEGTKGLKYDMRQKSLLVEWTSSANGLREPTAFENLSDGQRAVIGLVADIARRMCVLNPQLGQDVTSKTPGVVLIDEIDMHLHPRWQRIVTSGLKRAFPEVQFIVASHSPQVLGELHPDEIILLRTGDTSHPQVSYGLTSSQVLEEIMGADARTPAVQQKLDTTFDVLERGQLDAARENLAELEAMAPGIPELAGAAALLRRKEIIGR